MEFRSIWRIFLFCFCCFIVSADIFRECEIQNVNDIFIESERGCSWYIYCKGNDSFEAQCEEGYYFNQREQLCDPQDEVQCRFDAPTTRTTATTRQTSISATTLRTSTSTTRQTATAWTTSEPATTTFTSESTTLTTTTTTTSNPITQSCPISENSFQLVFLPHPKSCSEYFICYHGQEIPMHCSAMLHFNELTSKCDYPEKARCQVDFSRAREQCQPHVTDFFPHADNCNYYYYCKNGYLMLEHCPLYYGWDYERRACVIMRLATCYNRAHKLKTL